jgi:hypothetical protein
METQGPIGRDAVATHSLCILGHYLLKVGAQEILKILDAYLQRWKPRAQ